MADTDRKSRIWALATGLVASFALLLRLYLTLHGPRGLIDGLIDYFGYLTELTNGLVAVAMLWPVLGPNTSIARFFRRPDTTGWITASIAFVGIAYWLLLSRHAPRSGPPWLANVLLHYVVPPMMLLFSLLRLRGMALPWRLPCWWALYLIVYFIYALVRGALIGSYPYGFIDVTRLGYLTTVRNGVMLLGAFLVLAYALLVLWRMLGRRR